MAFSIGLTSADRNFPTRRFWDSLANRRPGDIRFFGHLRFWTRVFDAPAVAAAGLNTFERIGPKFAGIYPSPSIHSANAPEVRSYEPRDLARCLQWVRAQSSAADLRILWSLPRLSLQLKHDYARTLIFDGSGEEGGFLNYYSIDWSGARVIRVALIDLFAGNLGLRHQLHLLKAAERRMKAEGIQLALMMVSSAAPALPLLAGGFTPLPTNVDFFSIFPDPDLRLETPLRYHLLFT